MEKKYYHTDNVELELGGILKGFELEFFTFGKLNQNKTNVVWVTHALTANANAADWWKGLIGKNSFFNPEEYFIVCANIIGSCYGSTGPLSINSDTQTPYFHNFPTITVRDIVKTLDLLREHLKITKIDTLIGGSLGGQQALEWAIEKPELIKNLILLATNAKHSPWGIAFNQSQRLAIETDATWKSNNAFAGEEGLIAARSIALLSYRNYSTYTKTQTEIDINKTDYFKASSYQNYQGNKLKMRFNAFSYYLLTKVMDSHNVGRKRESVEKALNKIKARTLIIGISSDILFPTTEQKYLTENIKNAQYKEIDSLYGHDGFLLETEKITQQIKLFTTQKIKIDYEHYN